MSRATARLAAAALAAATVLGFAVPASAGTLEIDPGGNIEAVSLIEEEFVILNLGGPRIVCQVTLELDVSSASKTEGVQFGTVDDAEADDCINGAEIEFLGLPWTITYQAITGGLPSEISEVIAMVRDVELLISTCEWRCLYVGELDTFLPLFHIFPEEPYTNQLLRIWDSLLLERNLGRRPCPEGIPFEGTFTLDPTQTIVDV